MKKYCIVKLEGYVQKYEWGKKGSESLVAQLSGNESKNEPFSELWMGTHPNGCAKVVHGNTPLDEYLKINPEYGGTLDDGQLPFLFKILSVDRALSIQAHPSKSHAEELHKKDPVHYRDDNYKPELAVALTKFELLCCFKKDIEMPKYLRKLVGDFDGLGDDSLKNNTNLRCCFSKLMESKEEDVSKYLNLHLNDISQKSKKSPEDSLCMRLAQQFPGDVGCFVPYFLNYVTLDPGQAIFLAPNEPHSYLSGNCVECMACSDNVVRAGLTPKFRDTKVLCEMLTYDRAAFEKVFLGFGSQIAKGIQVYKPVNIPEFMIWKISCSRDQTIQYTTKPCQILIIIEAEECQIMGRNQHLLPFKKDLRIGDIFLIGSNTNVKIKGNCLAFAASENDIS